jgi:hypothetical protein
MYLIDIHEWTIPVDEPGSSMAVIGGAAGKWVYL